MKSCRLINLVCIFVSAGFSGAIFWLWRGVFVDHPVNMVGNIPLFKREDILKNKISAIIPATSTIFTTTTLAISATVATVPTVVVLEDASTEAVIDSSLTGRLALDRDDINLDVPYTSQAPERDWGQPWQDACEEAAVLMLDAYYKGYNLSPLFAKDEIIKMIDWEEKLGWESSIDSDKVKQLVEDYFKLNRKVRILDNPTAIVIKNYIATGHPVLVLADGKILKNPYYANGGPRYHALIIRGFTKDKFITNDPGVNRGRNFVFPVDNIMESIHDWNGGDVQGGRKVVLVIE